MKMAERRSCGMKDRDSRFRVDGLCPVPAVAGELER